MHKELLNLSKKINKFCVGMEGNISAKKSNSILIKASGSKLSSLIEEDLVLFDFEGNILARKF